MEMTSNITDITTDYNDSVTGYHNEDFNTKVTIKFTGNKAAKIKIHRENRLIHVLSYSSTRLDMDECNDTLLKYGFRLIETPYVNLKYSLKYNIDSKNKEENYKPNWSDMSQEKAVIRYDFKSDSFTYHIQYRVCTINVTYSSPKTAALIIEFLNNNKEKAKETYLKGLV